MEAEFNQEALNKNLESLPAWKKFVFALSVCERLYPNFVRFCDEVGFSGQDKLRVCLDSAWESVELGELDVDYSLNAQACESLAPDTEDYETVLASSALDAAASISYLMSYFVEQDNELFLEIASLACDSVDMFVQELEDLNPQDSKLEDKILEHPLMQLELSRQRSDIEFLNGLDDDLKVSFIEVKDYSFKPQKSNLELPM